MSKKINSKKKGKTGELEVAKILRNHGYNGRRSVQYSGANGDADVIGLPGFHLEVKRVESLNLGKAMKQAQCDARKGEIPVVVHRKNRTKWKITMDFEQFLELLEGGE